MRHTDFDLNPCSDITNHQCNIWINANAGSGKTSIIVKRFLSLILHNTPPHAILCLTYTKNAAREMRERIMNKAQKWLTMNDDELWKDIATILPSPCQDHISIAKTLLPKLLLSTESLNINTIHAFCGNILGQCKQDISMYSRPENVINEWQLSIIKRQIIQDILRDMDKLITCNANYLACCMKTFVQKTTTRKLQNIVGQIIDEQITNINNKNIKILLGVCHESTIESATITFMSKINVAEIISLANAMLQGPKTLVNRGNKILHWSKLSSKDKILNINILISNILNSDLLPLSNFPNKKLRETFPNIDQSYENIATITADFAQKKQNVMLYQLSQVLPYLINKISQLYKQAKKNLHVVDFNDLLLITLSILSDDKNQWLLQNIDSTLHHIMLDEAQDTSPVAWNIINKISEDFFSGHGSHQILRTILVVGDEKQSIFSFQGANLDTFHNMYKYLKMRSTNANIPFASINLLTSYRSCKAILASVDLTFNKKGLLQAITRQPQIKHIAKNSNDIIGKVKILTTKRSHAAPSEISWLPENVSKQYHLQSIINDAVQLLQQIISSGNNEDDIMIIMRNREGQNNFTPRLIEAIQQCNMRTIGADKFLITNHIVYRDILSLCNFALMPHYDLNTACLLRSPFFKLDLDTIANLCINGKSRKKTLWQTLHLNMPDTFAKLQDYHESAKNGTFTSKLLDILLDNEIHNAYHNAYGQTAIDVLNITINAIVTMSHLNLQELASYLKNTKLTISNINNNCGIKIMTAHAAKGMESKIVILIDTHSDICRTVKMKRDNIIKLDQENAILIPKSNERSKICSEILTKNDKAKTNEEMRLLYVAMTRAMEQLYIIGMENNNVKENWVNIVQA